MNRNSIIFYFFLLLAAITSVPVVHSCANRGYPEGGPKDTISPVVLYERPLSYSKDFSKKRVDIYFDEFIQLKQINEKFIISPPQAKKPKVSGRGKYVRVELLDSLRPNTTYSLDFADAIVDNNEGNPLGFYRYVFSTGKTIDSLELSGNVVDAITNEPVLNAYVFLYKNHADSVPVIQIPDYIARTDSVGFFRVTNLNDTIYKIVAIEDANRDYKFTPEGERVGFLDSLVRPVVVALSHSDTITRIEKIVGKDTIMSDTIIHVDALGYGPNNLYLRLFEEKRTQLYMVDDARKERERLDFIFSIPGENDFKILLRDTTVKDWYIMERTANHDTITLWIKDSIVYKKDTLNCILTYLRSDSTGRHVSYSDTNRYTFSDKKPTSDRNRKKEDTSIKFLQVNVNAGTELDMNTRLALSFGKPIDEEGLSHISLSERVDTLLHPVKYTIRRDSLKIRKFYFDANLLPGKEYLLKIDSATIYSIYGEHNNRLEKSFKIKTAESYGKIILTVTGIEQGDVIIQLYKSEGGGTKSNKDRKDVTVFQEKILEVDGTVTFEFLNEGKYQIRAIFDTNRNGKWDTGLYLKRVQPEKIKYLQGELNVKQNFDVEQDFDLHGL